MAGLSDMEELLSKISNTDFVDYMREAIACYNGGAYRGCIVMCYIALFDDIREKLGELAKVNSAAKKIWQDVEKRIGNQEVFEGYMADTLQAKGLLEAKKYQRLNMVRDLRNKAAHPSGVHASAEEARFVFRVVIVEFLSESLLKTTHGVDALIHELKSSNFFPTSRMSDIEDIVKDELDKIHKKAFPYLVAQLLHARGDTDKNSKSNGERFLVGMASLALEDNRQLLRKNVISACSVNKDNAAFIGRMVSADASLLGNLSPKDHARINKILLENSKKSTTSLPSKFSNPERQFSSVVSSLDEADILEYYDAYVDDIFEKYPYTPVFFKALRGKDKIVSRLVGQWKKNAGSSIFDVANKFAGAIEEIDSAVGILLSDQDSFEIIVGIKEAANWNAFDSKSLVRSNFSDAPKIVAAAKKYISENESKAEKLIVSRSIADNIEEFLEAVFGD